MNDQLKKVRPGMGHDLEFNDDKLLYVCKNCETEFTINQMGWWLYRDGDNWKVWDKRKCIEFMIKNVIE